jgi:polyhydroxyalkanoate synthesis regulator protein
MVCKNTGKSPSIETMYSYVSIYGNNVKVVRNSFLTPRTRVYTGIEIGSRVRNKLSNIYIYKNEFKAINAPKDSLNSQIRVQGNIEGLSVTKNSSVGFYYAVALSKVADYKVGSFTFKDNKLDVNEIFEKPMPLLK